MNRKTLSLPRQVSPALLRYLPLLLLLVLVLALLLPRLTDRMGQVSGLREEKEALQREVEDLRQKARSLPELQARLAQLEGEFRAVPWPQDPRAGGLARLEEGLRERGWKVNAVDVSGGDPLPGGIPTAKLTLKALVPGYPELVAGLDHILTQRISLSSIQVSKEESLEVSLVLGIPLVEVRQ